jgi:flagellar motor switch protein FliM
MEKILTQQEIDAMVSRARGGAPATQTGASFSRWDYRQAGRLGRDHMVAISALHDVFARTVTTPSARTCVLRFKFQWRRRNISPAPSF